MPDPKELEQRAPDILSEYERMMEILGDSKQQHFAKTARDEKQQLAIEELMNREKERQHTDEKFQEAKRLLDETCKDHVESKLYEDYFK